MCACFGLWTLEIYKGMAVSIVIFNKTFFPSIVVSVNLSLGRQILGSCQINLLQKWEGICLEPTYLFIVILCISQNNKIELTNVSHSMVMKLVRQRLLNYFLAQNPTVCKIKFVQPLTERWPWHKANNCRNHIRDSQILLENTDTRLRTLYTEESPLCYKT